jgi:type IV secretion system protein VirB10
MSEPSPHQDPTVPEERILPKPVKSIRIAIYFLIAAFGVYLLSSVSQCGSGGSKLAKSSQVLPPSVVHPESLSEFQQSQTEQAERLKKQAAAASAALAKAKGAYDAYSNGLPCNPTLAGTPGTAVDGTPIVCGPDGLWRPVNAAAMDVNTTNPAADARARQRQAAADKAQHAKEEAARRHRAALASGTIAIDFTGTPSQRESSPREAAPPSPAHESDNTAAPAAAPTSAVAVKPAKYDWARHTGKTYKVFEGTVLETVLTNRINGSAAGPINTMVTTDLWSHDHQKLLIPQGTRCLGTVSAVNSGNQQRLFVSFHRCVMPDGYPLDLDRFAGLNQIGEAGLRDLVNHHYVQIFGASLAIGAVAGLAQIGNSTGGFGYDPSVAIRNGVSQQTSQESIHVLDRFLNQLPTFTIRERARVKIYLSADLDVPAYDTHEVDPTL